MDAKPVHISEEVICFDLLSDNFELQSIENMSEIDSNLPESLNELLNQISTGDPQENDADFTAFEKQNFDIFQVSKLFPKKTWTTYRMKITQKALIGKQIGQ